MFFLRPEETSPVSHRDPHKLNVFYRGKKYLSIKTMLAEITAKINFNYFRLIFEIFISENLTLVRLLNKI